MSNDMFYRNNKGKLGFGLMRLPKLEDGSLDYEQVCEMVDRFMAASFTYFDTAWAYEGSEEVMRRALVERYPRESYTIADKMAAWMGCQTREEALQQLEVSLERCGVTYFDYYLLHNLGSPRTEVFDRFDLWSFLREKKEEGVFRKIGFSFHGTAEELNRILEAHPELDFVQLQINYADWDHPVIQSEANYQVAVKHGLPVVVMEPLKGGMLANPPERVREVLEADSEVSPAIWAYRFAADLEHVEVVLSGMSSLAQAEENIQLMSGFRGFADEERIAVQRAAAELKKVPLIPCTACNYCAKVCPANIGISGTFEAMNYLTMYHDLDYAIRQEGFQVKLAGRARAADCIGCGACEQACPQQIAIRDELAKAVDVLGIAKGDSYEMRI